MSKVLYWLLLGASAQLAHAHQANKAYFHIAQKARTVEVTAELPWAIRNALVTYRPVLAKGGDFDQAFFRYVQENLVLANTKGQKMRLVGIKALESMGHHHRFRFTFQGLGLAKVTNTIMFNQYATQANHHEVQGQSGKMAFVTTNGFASFRLTASPTARPWWARWAWLALAVAIAGALSGLRRRLRPRPAKYYHLPGTPARAR